MFSRKMRLALLGSVATVAGAGSAHAQSATTAGTQINNTASVSYTVNGQAATTSSTTASFVVDRKVNFSVVLDQTGNTQVNLGQTGAVVKFKVTNTTNGIQDFILDPDQSTLSVGLVTGTDNFDITGMKAYVDSNGNGIYEPTLDTKEYIDELAPDASVAVFLVGDVPNVSTINMAQVSLHVIAAAGGAANVKGSALVATDLALGNADSTVDIVFADDDSDGTLNLGDIARNGQGRAYGGLEIGARSVALTVTKSALVLSDDVNIINPKALPGATVQYCLRVNNATVGTPASNVVLTDIVPANTTYVPGSISIGTPGGTCVLLGSTEDDDDSDVGEADGVTANFNTATRTVSANVGAVGGLGSIAVAFKVKID